MAWYWIVLIAYFAVGIILGLINYWKTVYWDFKDFLFTLFLWGLILLIFGVCALIYKWGVKNESE